jgi:N-acetylglucosaminyldiphosphoundecaprenol N-acetyl-beta-D-mannosaminyltransferase
MSDGAWSRDVINFLGIPINRLDLEETVERIAILIAEGSSNRIVVVNAGKVVKCRDDRALKEVIESADLIGPDGQWIVFASWLLGDPLPGRVNGTDLMERLLARGAHERWRFYFLGARQPVVERVVEVARERYPGIVVAGSRNGYFDESEEDEVVEAIRRTEADIMFVAMPSPRKEYFISKHLDRLGVKLCHGVGGSFDVMAGVVKRAPVWMQHWGFEWLYRWLQDPTGMAKRNLTESPLFVALVLREAIRRRISPNGKRG